MLCLLLLMPPAFLMGFPMPMAMFALISRMFDPGIAAIASLMILMSIVIVIVLERLTGLQRAMSV